MKLTLPFPKLIFYTICVSLMGLGGCKCNRENVTICPETTARFKMTEIVSFENPKGWVEQDIDSVTTAADVLFEAEVANAKYIWKIGAGTYNTQKVRLSFKMKNNDSVPIILTVIKKSNDCEINNDTIRTLKRMLRFFDTPSYYGEFIY